MTKFSLQPSRCGAAEILGGEVGLLQHGAHGAIQDEDALAEKFAKGQALLDQVSHVFTIIPRESAQERSYVGLCGLGVNRVRGARTGNFAEQ